MILPCGALRGDELQIWPFLYLRCLLICMVSVCRTALLPFLCLSCLQASWVCVPLDLGALLDLGAPQGPKAPESVHAVR